MTDRIIPMKPCISETSTMPASFLEDVDAYTSAGCKAMEVWLTKLETALETQAASDLKKYIQDKQLTLVAAGCQGRRANSGG
jgi:hypothetical protein